MVKMSIKEQIFYEFIKKLSNEKEFSKSLIENINDLIFKDEKITEKKIINLIERGVKIGSKNKKD